MPVPRTRRLAASAFLAAAALVASGDRVGACSCGHVPVCYSVDAASGLIGGTVFIGTVLEDEHPATRFRVDRMISGEPAAEVILGRLYTSCDLRFRAGEQYLVYAYQSRETGALATSFCSRTRPIGDPQAAADIAYFDAHLAGRPTDGWLGGVVEERHYDVSRGPDGRVREWVVRPLADIPVTISSPEGETRSTATDANGWYGFSGVSAGEWRVAADLPAPFRPHDGLVTMLGHLPSATVRWLKGATCAEANVDARVDGIVRGVLFDERGLPARGIPVELMDVAALETDPDTFTELEAVTDEQGQFEFRPIPAGRYILGVGLNDRPHREDVLDRRRYNPGVRERSAATVIELDRGARVLLEPFRLPELPTDRTISIVLRAPTPDVAAGTQVYLAGPTKRLLDLSAGSIALELPFGAQYRILVVAPAGHTFEFERSDDPTRTRNPGHIDRDDTGRTISIRVLPR
jgi:hypothetical protein